MTSKKLEALHDRVSGKTPAINNAVMDAHINEKIEVTIGDLREAVAANPKHEAAEAYRKACGDNPEGTPLPSTRSVIVDKADLQSLLEDRKVSLIREADQHGNPVVRKVLEDAPKPVAESKKKSADK